MAVKIVHIVFFFLFLSCFTNAFADYPEIKSLANDDFLYKQLENSIDDFYQKSKKNPFYAPELSIYVYKPKSGIDLYSLAARINLPYETLATANRVSSAPQFGLLSKILIPSIPGIFIPTTLISDLDQIMFTGRSSSKNKAIDLVLTVSDSPEKFLFFSGERFTPIERAFFLEIAFRFPLARGSITSGFGTRSSPFSGHPEIHTGIDIGANRGTEVFAVREGVIITTGFDSTYGNFILIEHQNGYQSFYGHLESILVEKNQKVSSGTIIGKVGTTGKSTGPHLHFELRKKGIPVNPEKIIRNAIK
jgi:murein DD-endopeptidase MepM/ murein hydrolase activator NlpD